jgi:hypothetical protein
VDPVTGFQNRFTEVVPASKMASSKGELSTGTEGTGPTTLFTLKLRQLEYADGAPVLMLRTRQ